MTAGPTTDPLTEAFRTASGGARIRDIGEAALLMGALDRRGEDLGPYRAHLAELASAAGKHRDVRGASVRGQILADIMVREFGYEGDEELFENPDNANLLSVIDRRAGVPVLLGVLYLHIARATGWPASGIAFPGQFLVRIEGEDGVVVIDPYDEGREVQPADLYSMLHRVAGRMARLDDSQLEPVADQEVLLRVLSNLKALAVRDVNYGRALELLDRMLVLFPNEASFLFEQAQLLSHEGRPMAAKRKFEAIVALDPQSPFAERCRDELAGIRHKLN